FAVAGKNSAGVGDTSKVVDAKIAIPDAPVLVSAYGRTDTRLSGKITLLWRSVTDAEGYKVFYGKSTGVYTDSVDARNCSGFRLTKLDQDTEYYIAIAAYNDLGKSTLSNEITATTIHERPVSPHQVRVTENGMNELVLEWERSKDFDFGSNFKVYRSDKPYTGYELVASNVVGTTYTDKTILGPGKYYYTVKGENQKGVSFYPSNKSMIDKQYTTQTESVLTDGKPIAVYPNPTNDYINIILRDDISNAQFNLYNVVGATVMQGDLNIDNRLDISGFQAGIYLLKVSTNSGETTEMIQIQ
ncbi:MAG: T9SS type A sorting domain-containing protein, partial [Bacteroidales bacterium]|nr:T9SS type A sorting domain-containing protein [Bacteroidales bacterium]